jgi:hypothetical protein
MLKEIEIRDEANEQGFKCGLYYGFIFGVIATLMFVALVV